MIDPAADFRGQCARSRDRHQVGRKPPAGRGLRPDRARPHAMNTRAADAIVSSAPKPIKILPISEVWSQVELSLLARTTGGGGVSAGVSAEATAVGAAAGAGCFRGRSESLGESG